MTILPRMQHHRTKYVVFVILEHTVVERVQLSRRLEKLLLTSHDLIDSLIARNCYLKQLIVSNITLIIRIAG